MWLPRARTCGVPPADPPRSPCGARCHRPVPARRALQPPTGTSQPRNCISQSYSISQLCLNRLPITACSAMSVRSGGRQIRAVHVPGPIGVAPASRYRASRRNRSCQAAAALFDRMRVGSGWPAANGMETVRTAQRRQRRTCLPARFAGAVDPSNTSRDRNEADPVLGFSPNGGTAAGRQTIPWPCSRAGQGNRARTANVRTDLSVVEIAHGSSSQSVA